MLRNILAAAIVITAIGSFACAGAQAAQRINKHRHAVPQQVFNDISNFSSSSGLHVGVNHPPRK
jgi:hypothetical protein